MCEKEKGARSRLLEGPEPRPPPPLGPQFGPLGKGCENTIEPHFKSSYQSAHPRRPLSFLQLPAPRAHPLPLYSAGFRTPCVSHFGVIDRSRQVKAHSPRRQRAIFHMQGQWATGAEGAGARVWPPLPPGPLEGSSER